MNNSLKNEIFVCFDCCKNFVSHFNKLRHQKSCKLFLQNKLNNTIKHLENEIEEMINKNFFSNKQIEEQSRLIQEQSKQLQEQTKLIEEQKIEIMKLQLEININSKNFEGQQKLIELAIKQPKQTYNNNQQININVTPFTHTFEDIKQIISEAFTDEVFDQGQLGVAKMAFEKLLFDPDCNSKYVVSNYDKDIFTYKNRDDEIKTDVKAKNLTDQIYEVIAPKSKLICDRKLEEEEKLAEQKKISQETKFTKQTLIMDNHNEIMKLNLDSKVFVGEIKILSKNENTVLKKKYLKKKKEEEDRLEFENYLREKKIEGDLNYDERKTLDMMERLKDKEGETSSEYKKLARYHKSRLKDKLGAIMMTNKVEQK